MAPALQEVPGVVEGQVDRSVSGLQVSTDAGGGCLREHMGNRGPKDEERGQRRGHPTEQGAQGLREPHRLCGGEDSREQVPGLPPVWGAGNSAVIL